VTEVKEVVTEDVVEESGEFAEKVETSEADTTAEEQPGVTDEALETAQAEEKQKQSDFDYSKEMSKKWDSKMADLKAEYPTADLTRQQEKSQQEKKTTTEEVGYDPDGLVTKADLKALVETMGMQFDEVKADSRSTAFKEQDDKATALISGMLHDYGYMEDGLYLHEATPRTFTTQAEIDTDAAKRQESKSVQSILREHMSMMHVDVSPAQAAASFKRVIDGQFARKQTAGKQRRIEEKAVKEKKIENTLARPSTSSAPAQQKEEIDPVILSNRRARKLMGLDQD